MVHFDVPWKSKAICKTAESGSKFVVNFLLGFLLNPVDGGRMLRNVGLCPNYMALRTQKITTFHSNRCEDIKSKVVKVLVYI
jgi:hypothetical protein